MHITRKGGSYREDCNKQTHYGPGKEGKTDKDWEEQENLSRKLANNEHKSEHDLATKIQQHNKDIKQHRAKVWNLRVQDNLHKPPPKN